MTYASDTYSFAETGLFVLGVARRFVLGVSFCFSSRICLNSPVRLLAGIKEGVVCTCIACTMVNHALVYRSIIRELGHGVRLSSFLISV